ncbi:hypothetical protein LTR85_007881 [Meristemomyces frigidus]|nr:hypothetical protein LTR85_007881 [Meristemomyces frigidus]
MKLTIAALATLAYTTLAAPVDEAVQRRAVCTTNGFTYSCAGATTATSAATTAKSSTTALATTTAKTTSTAAATTTAKTSSTTAASGAAPTGTTGYTSGDTASDVDNGVCAQLTVIFARGTGESGTIGTVAGPPMFKQLSTDLNKKVALQGVSYPASSSVVHNAIAKQSVDASKIAAIVVFGDPLNGQSFGSVPSSKILEICGSSDSICDSGTTNVSGGHTDYGNDASMAASFIEKTAGVSA